MKYQYFIASRWRNKDQVLELAEKLRQQGKTVFCFVEHKADVTKGETDPDKFMQQFESIENWTENEVVKQVFEYDMEGLKNSENLLLLLPAGKSAHIEAGIAYGLGKKCIVIGEQPETESLYLIFDEFYSSIDEFMKIHS